MEVDRNLSGKTILIETKNGQRKKRVLIKCPDCDIERFMRIDYWKKRKSDRCHECSAREYIKPPTTHHLSHTKIYARWKSMMGRCFDDKNCSFPYYGGRGISVDNEWLDNTEGFLNFYKWAILNGFKEGLQLDRIDNDGDYSPNNCRWITQKENICRMENLFGYKGRKVKQYKGEKV